MAKHLEGDGTIFADQAIMPDGEKTSLRWSRNSEVWAEDRRGCLNGCCNLTTAIYDGLNVQNEINAVKTQSVGDTVLLWHDESRRRLASFMPLRSWYRGWKRSLLHQVWHSSPRGQCCVKHLWRQKASRLVAGVNTQRHEAYRKMISLGFRNEIQGVVMDRPNEPAYNKPEIYLIDDW
jgi:hypothetical protein